MAAKKNSALKGIFVIPIDDNKQMIYAPFSKVVFTTDKKSLPKIANFYKSLLKDNTTNTKVPKKTSSKEENNFGNMGVTLCLTTDCNLRCVYCYASGGERKTYMDWKVAKAAMNMAFSNSRHHQLFALSFHGGGEPFMAFDMMKRCVEYAKKKCERGKKKLRIGVTTNGVMTDEKIEWVLKNNVHLNISFDGTPEVQDIQRPLPNNQPSHALVEKTISTLVKKKIDFIVRSTITKDTVGKMKTIVEYFHGLGIRSVHFEPAFECGRCLKTKTSSPDPMEFATSYIKSLEVAERYGMNLYYSGGTIDKLSNTFCGAAGKNFFVTADGYITSCLEVQHKDDSASKVFFYGKYDAKKGKFTVFKNRLKMLSSRKVSKIDSCQSCFCKFHCAGDCLAKGWKETGSLFKIGKSRCIANRELTKYILLRYLHGRPIKMRDFESGKKIEIV